MRRIKSNHEITIITILLLADVFMIFTGYIGEQQLDAGNNILVTARLTWGAISTIGYIIIPVLLLFRLWKKYKDSVHPMERKAFKLMALNTPLTKYVYTLISSGR